MATYADKTPAPKTGIEANAVAQNKNIPGAGRYLADNRPSSVVQKKLKEGMNPKDGVIQPKIFFDNISRKFSSNAIRLPWVKSTDQKILEDYQLRQNSNETKVDYKGKNLDRAHVLSFDYIQSSLVDFLNNNDDVIFKKKCFTPLTQTLAESENKNDEEELQEINTSLARLLKAIQQKNSRTEIVSKANALLKMLNSVSTNLRAGNKNLNAYIGKHLDPKAEIVVATGQLSWDNHSKNILKTGNQTVKRTPDKKEAIVSSEGRLPINNFTPESKALADKAQYETHKITSKPVKRALYGNDPSVLNAKKRQKKV